MLELQPVDSKPIFQLTFGFVWICLEIFDLDGHILGTIQDIGPSIRVRHRWN
jgi:hypothetical protein